MESDLMFGLSFAVLVVPTFFSVLVYKFVKNMKKSKRRIKVSVPSSSATSTGTNNYNVFLSFRGPDCRKHFVDHLYNNLKQVGIYVFRDDNELCEGEEIDTNLLQAIKNSKISIPILSPNYASSMWCLEELVQMMECKKNFQKVVLPVFYDVEPAHVKHQIGKFGEGFSLISGKYHEDHVKKWKQALEEVASLKAWVSLTSANGHEGELVNMIVGRVWSKLKEAFQLNVPEKLVGIDDAEEEILRLVENSPSATKIIGIYGTAGIGKTTLAKVVYNKLSHKFRHCSFIANIGQISSQGKDITCLYNQLISDILKTNDKLAHADQGIGMMTSRFKHKKVLILLDDVVDRSQLNALVGKHEWFGVGSRIIITTRIQFVVDDPMVDHKHELQEISREQSLILFSRHAFWSDSPPHEFELLSKRAVSIIGGLPLALEVTGLALCGQGKKLWEKALVDLWKTPPQEVQNKLRFSYKGLKQEEKQMFLDIACFFIGTDSRIASYMWHACDYPLTGVDRLSFMSQIKVGDNHELIMHDQLKELGRRIVREENLDEPENRSRLWAYKEASKALPTNEDNKKIKALRLDKEGSSKFMAQRSFKRLPKLKFLHVSEVEIAKDFEKSLPELRWLKWERCPNSAEVTNAHLENLLILDLSDGFISKSWGGWHSIKMEGLKVLNLTKCAHLTSTPDLSKFKNLEMLILEGCEDLEKIDCSIGEVESLVSLNLRSCVSLKELPDQLGKLKNLEELLVDKTSIREIPQCIGSLQKLTTLSAVGCRLLTRVPSSISSLVNLSTLNLNTCKRLPELPVSFEALTKLQRLSLARCYILEQIPSSIGELEELVELDLSSTRIKKLPESIEKLKNLEILRISHSEIERLPSAIGKLERLRELDASGCHKLKGEILVDKGGLPSLRTLRLGRAKISRLSKNFRQLPLLQHLDLLYCSELHSPPKPPVSLSSLQLTCRSYMLPSLSRLRYLKKLTLHSCMSLQSIPKLPSCIRKLRVWKCPELKRLPELSNLTFLSELELLQCYGLEELNGLEALKSLRKLDVSTSTELSNLDDFEDLESLRYSDLQSCDGEMDNLRVIGGLDQLKSLEVLNISERRHIEGLDLSNSKHLKSLIVKNCRSLVKIQCHVKIESLEHFERDGCNPLRISPDFLARDRS